MIAIRNLLIEPYKQCDFRDKWGPNIGDNDSKKIVSKKVGDTDSIKYGSGCARGLLKHPLMKELMESYEAPSEEAGSGQCHQLNGFSQRVNAIAQFHKYRVPDVKLQWIQPKLPCNQCKVKYSISADIDEDE